MLANGIQSAVPPSNKLKSKKDCDRIKVEGRVSEFFFIKLAKPLDVRDSLSPALSTCSLFPSFIAVFVFISKWLHLAVVWLGELCLCLQPYGFCVNTARLASSKRDWRFSAGLLSPPTQHIRVNSPFCLLYKFFILMVAPCPFAPCGERISWSVSPCLAALDVTYMPTACITLKHTPASTHSHFFSFILEDSSGRCEDWQHSRSGQKWGLMTIMTSWVLHYQHHKDKL